MSLEFVLPMSLEFFVTYVPERFRILFLLFIDLKDDRSLTTEKSFDLGRFFLRSAARFKG
jgi:hypothetical protein